MEDKNLNEVNEFETEEILDDVITLIDEEGQATLFQIIGQFDFEGSSYAVLGDMVEGEDLSDEDINAVIYKIMDEDGEDVLFEIEDDEEWNKVVDYWNSLCEE